MELGILIIIVIIISLIHSFFYEPKRLSPEEKGEAGESIVADILCSLPEHYQVINNVLIQNQERTSQIDHIVVSPFGIFVIETKNYSGIISGAEGSENWKESFKTTGSHYFRNPIKQNWGHIYALSEYLNYDKRLFKSIIVFSDSADLHVNATVPVIYISQLKETILSYQQELLLLEEIDPIAKRLKEASYVDADTEDKHTQSVRTIITKKEEALRSGKCPKCGGDLVFRNGKYGSFYGCSNYPKCTYTNNLRW